MRSVSGGPTERPAPDRRVPPDDLGRSGVSGASGPERRATGLEWSEVGAGRSSTPTWARGSSPWPLTHSGSGPSRGSPVKNLAAMQPPWQASNWPQLAQAPADWGSRSSVKRSDRFQTSVKPPGSRTLPALNSSWRTKGQA